MRYVHYDVEDFANDLKFREWILNPSPHINFFWEKWLLGNPEKKEVVEQARILVLTFQFEERAFSENDKQRLLTRINKTIASKGKEKDKDVKILPIRTELDQSYLDKYKVKPSKNRWLRVAVVLVGVMLSSVLITQIVTKGKLQEEKVALIEKENRVGRQTVVLPDGSVVVLNAESKLTFPSAFTDEVREVRLSGEAFFDVVKDLTKPFVVKANGLTTHVLGTSFNVKSYPDASSSTIALVSGKVWVEKNVGKEESMELVPGEAVDFNLEKDEFIKGQFNYMEAVGWKDGVLYLNATPLSQVFDKLELWYGVDFQYSNLPENTKSVSGSFKNESLDNVLQSVSYTVDFDYTINGKKVTVKFK